MAGSPKEKGRELRRLRKIFVALLVLPVGFGAFLWVAAGPAVSPKEWPAAGVIRFFSPSSEAQSPPRSLKIVTYNIGYASGDKNNRAAPLSREEVEANLRAMAEALERLKADVFCLQEVDFQAARTFGINQMEVLARRLGTPYGAYAVTWNKRYLPWPYWPPQYQFGRIVSGQVILSRLPIERQDLRFFEKPAANPFWYNWFYPDRVLQKVGIKIGKDSLWVWNVHLEAFDPPTRRLQSEELARWVQKESSPLKWVAGDFNSVSQIRGGLESLQGPEAHHGLEPSQKKELEDRGESLRLFLQITGLKNAETEGLFSFPSWDPMKKIDHILYEGRSFRLERVGNEAGLFASDHLPVWAELSVTHPPD